MWAGKLAFAARAIQMGQYFGSVPSVVAEIVFPFSAAAVRSEAILPDAAPSNFQCYAQQANGCLSSQ